jgi:FAD/FMN-containing dehydrogenase/Fe-S oxidoreductase
VVLTNTQQEQLRRATDCELRFDDLTRQLYSTDASIYQIEPVAVAFPKSAGDAASVIRAAGDMGINIIPRGAGTGLAGGAVGSGLVIDFARYNRQITEFDAERRTVRVAPGVVLDQLNAFLARQGLWYGPDVATSSRATVGGMIANNSSGARSPVFGTTAEHLKSVEIILADGRILNVGEGFDPLPEIRSAVDGMVTRHADLIRDRLHDRIPKRWPGYGFDRYLKKPGDLAKIVAGSEGTLCAIMSAELNLVPLPRRRALGVLFFASVAEAMQASVEILDLKPAAIEHVDRLLFDQTKGRINFKAARDLMELDAKPSEAFLIVEFFDEDTDDKLGELMRRKIGLRKLLCKDPAQQLLIWNLRKQGLTLLTACKGVKKPTPGIEDVCVPPDKLPEYVNGLMSIVEPLGVQASYYGHAASGLLHVRPKLDLHTAEDIAKYRKITDQVADLTRRFKGSFAAEHGVGIARTEYVPDLIGPELMDACRQVKQMFDPKNLLNPGKIIDNGENYRIDTRLRYGDGYEIKLPFEPVFGFVERDESFVRNLEQCNGCGGCRKDPPTMCPTYLATGEEIMVTRGRANTIRATLDNKFTHNGELLFSKELEQALEYCLSCKACKTECPSNVDLSLLKAELTHARHKAKGVPLLDRLISNADLLGRLNAGPQAPIVNAVLRNPVVRALMEKMLGFAAERTMPPYTSQRFDKWFAKRNRSIPRESLPAVPAGENPLPRTTSSLACVRRGRHGDQDESCLRPTSGSDSSRSDKQRGRVILWDDTWVRYNEPNIGKAAVKVLESAGFEVVLETRRKCCGRPACSRGVLDEVRRLAEHNIGVFKHGSDPIIFLEPSCYTMFVDEYRQLKISGADAVAKRCVLFEQFVFELLSREPDALRFKSGITKSIGIHGHCHAKALTNASIMPKLAAKLPGADAKLLDTGCCGMAGAFGMLRTKLELSKKVAQNLIDKINECDRDTTIVASGTSCRHQIHYMTDRHPLHMAELLAMALD